MKIQYLGTAAAEGIPAIWCNCELCEKIRKTRGKDVRTRSQVLIDDSLLVDLPPDSYMHMLNYNIPFYKIKNLIITHAHQDHFYPEELAMRSKEYAKNIKEPLHVYGNDLVVKITENTNEMEIPKRVVPHELQCFKEEKIGDFTVIPLKACHDPNENCLIYSIEHEGKRILYSNDTGEYPKETLDFIKENKLTFDLLSMDCTMGYKDSKLYHMGIPNIEKMQKKLIKAGAVTESTPVIVTHFSHNHYTCYDEFKEDIAEKGFIPSYDGMIYEL